MTPLTFWMISLEKLLDSYLFQCYSEQNFNFNQKITYISAEYNSIYTTHEQRMHLRNLIPLNGWLMSLDNCQRFECSEGYINYQSDNGFASESLDGVDVIVRARHDAIVNICVVLVKTYIFVQWICCSQILHS